MWAPRGKWLRLDPRASCDLTIEGSGVLRRLWCVFNADGTPVEAMDLLRQHPEVYRNVWVHIAFDDLGEVQVSAPLADLFLCGHGDVEDVDSRYVQTARIPPLDASPYQGALNCFAPMPFRECAKISFVNRNAFPVSLIASVDWLEREHGEEPFYFHATYARGRCRNRPMVLFDRRQAQGTFVGLGLYVHNRDRTHRWHELPEAFVVDGGAAVVGTGAEDFFCLAWGFRRRIGRPQFGVTCLRPQGGSPSLPSGRFNPAGEFAMYRFLLDDWVDFDESLRLTLGTGRLDAPESGEPLEFRSVAFWYGRERASPDRGAGETTGHGGTEVPGSAR